MEAIQNNIFHMCLWRKYFCRICKKLTEISKRKFVVLVTITKLLVEAPDIMLTGKYSTFWPLLLQGVIALFELPEEGSNDGDLFVDVEDTQGYSAAYSQLAFASRPELDPTGVGDPRLFLVKSLQKLDVSYADQTNLMMKNLDDRARTYIRQYMSAAGPTIS